MLGQLGVPGKQQPWESPLPGPDLTPPWAAGTASQSRLPRADAHGAGHELGHADLMSFYLLFKPRGWLVRQIFIGPIWIFDLYLFWPEAKQTGVPRAVASESSKVVAPGHPAVCGLGVSWNSPTNPNLGLFPVCSWELLSPTLLYLSPKGAY